MKHLVISLIFFATIAMSCWALIPSGFFRVHDFTQAARVAEMLRAVQDGQLPVRWSQNFGYGYGMPTFLFYAPLPYYVAAFVYWLTGNLMIGIRSLWFFPSLISFVGMFMFTNKHFGTKGALISAVAFTLAPYRAVDLYVRGAIGEIWGIALFPWILWAVDQLIERQTRPRLANLALVYGALCLSHNLMTMLFTPLAVMYAVVTIIRSREATTKTVIAKKMGSILASFSIGGGLALFYILPSLLEKQYTQIESRILGGYFSYNLHFLYIRQFFKENWKYGGTVWGPEDDISFFLGYGQLFLLFVLMSMTIVMIIQTLKYYRTPKDILKKFTRLSTKTASVITLITLSGFFLAISLFMTLLKSKFVWDVITPIQTAQFPWRFLSLVTFFLAILCGAVFYFIKNQKFSNALFATSLLILFIPSLKYFQPEFFLDKADTFYYDNPARIQKEMSGIWPDFLPIGLKGEPQLPAARVVSLQGDFTTNDFQLYVDRSHELLFWTKLNNPRSVQVNIADFPGWTVYIDGVLTPHSVSPGGMIQLILPAGERLISVRLNRTPVRTISDLISFTSFLIVLFLILPIRNRKQKVQHD